MDLGRRAPSSSDATGHHDHLHFDEKAGLINGSALKDVKDVLLSIQLDALAALVDEQATRRLWKVFHHCAGVIAHGRRLENLSWRTWGRDQTVRQAQLQLSTNNDQMEADAIEPLDKPTSSSGSSSITPRRRRSSSSRTWSSSPTPSYRRFDSNASTAVSLSGFGGSIPVSRSPPLGPLIKRVIFTPPDHGNDQLALYAASRIFEHDPERTRRLPVHLQQDRVSEESSVVHINPDLHVTPTPSHSATPKSQDNGPETSSGLPPTRTGDEPQRTVNSPFLTVIISQSTPKPTPPDTPARCLSPTTFQALTPLHALSLTHTLPPPSSSISPYKQQQQSDLISTSPSVKSHHTASSVPSSLTISSYRGMSETGTATRMPGEQSFSNKLHSNSIPQILAQPLLPEPDATGNVTGNANGDGAAAKHASDSTFPATASGSCSMSAANWLPISTQTGQGPSHPRMFFLQRDSNSFSPESNSRSHSHSRSPASPSRMHRRHDSNPRSSDARSPSRSRSSDSRSGNAVKDAGRGMDEPAGDGTRRPMSDGLSRLESHGSALVDQSVQINKDPARQPSFSPHGPPVFTNRSQRLMARNRRSHRAHLARTLDRPSSRSRSGYKGSPGSNGSRNSAAAGSLDNNIGSASVSGMGSVSTSSSSKLVMGRLNRMHPSSQKPSDKESSQHASRGAQQLPPSPLTKQNHSQPQQQVSALAGLPDPMRMEALERQVVQSTINRQSGGQRRKIALESDSDEDDESFDDEDEEEEASYDDVELKRGSSRENREPVVEDEDGSSWSDEDDVVIVPSKRVVQTTAPVLPPVRRDSQQEQTGSGSSGRHAVHHPGQKANAHLLHVKSKPRLAHHHQHAASPPPPARPQHARRATGHIAQAHARGSHSSDGLLAQAAREAQRQQDLFKPLPRETYSSTNLVREKSLTSLSRGGRPSNLTLLLNPDPHWFPQGHPYRESPKDPMDPKLSRSMEEIHARSGMKSPRPGVGLGFGGLKMTSTNASPVPLGRRDSAPMPSVAKAATRAVVAPVPAPAPAPAPALQAKLHQSPDKPSKSPPVPFKLRSSKSAMAGPVVLGVTASSAPRDERKNDMLEPSLRQMGARQQRQPRHATEVGRPSIDQLLTQSSNKSQELRGSSRGNRLGARPADVELSDSEEEDQSPNMNQAEASGRSLAQEHLAAVMGGKNTALVKAGLSASRTILASPDAHPHDTARQVESASYRPPAPPSSPSVYNPYEAKRAQGHLPHTPTPPSTTRPPVGRENRPRAQSSHGQLFAAADHGSGPLVPCLTRERRQPATSQPPVPVSVQRTSSAAVPWPYNLPYPAPLQSPRTTRLKMLAAEVPDDLRKDLLWERKTNRIVPILNDNGPTTIRRGSGFKPPKTLRPDDSGGWEESDESEEAMRERLQKEGEAKERYDKMRTRTWNGVIYQRPVW